MARGDIRHGGDPAQAEGMTVKRLPFRKLGLVFTIAAAGCGGNSDSTSPYRDNSAEVARIAAQIPNGFPNVRNTIILTQVPGQPSWTAAAGPGANVGGVFRSASLGKMVMAATVLRLAEDGKVKLDNRIDTYLTADLLTGLHVIDGIDRTGTITVRQLLNHTSGLPDYFEDGEPDGNGQSPFKQALLSDPERLWSPQEPILWTKANLRAQFVPGSSFHYSETGYQLLGLIVERVTGTELHVAYRRYIFDPLDMSHTSLEWREAKRSPLPIAPCYQGDLDLTEMRSLSSEWGGGGLLATAEDWSKFLRGVFEGRLFRKRETLSDMKRTSAQSENSYGLGLMRLNVDGTEMWGHMGYYSTWAMYDPARRVTYVGTLNQSEAQDSLATVAAALGQVVRDAQRR
jgi:D-alanyl-D-alanine carboxypeptidase